MWKPNFKLAVDSGAAAWSASGLKFFELSNHLGNVMVVINDNRTLASGNYEPVVINANDYYAFGSQMVGRSFAESNAIYRYGFNGKENDNEVKGTGNQQDYGMRIYDPRIGRFLSTDPITAQYPELTPYQFAGNMPIRYVDMDGLEPAEPYKTTKCLIIVVQGYEGSDPLPGKTQVVNNRFARSDDGDLNNLSSLESIKGVQVVQYSSSKGNKERTKGDVAKTLKDFHKQQPNGQVILVGHSYGADNLVELANENPDIKINALVTIDIATGPLSWDDDKIPSNVKTAKNYYKENLFEFGGEQIELKKGNKTSNISNVRITNAGHTTIDNKVEKGVEKFIKDYLKDQNKNEKSDGNTTTKNKN